MSGIELSQPAQHWLLAVLIWIGFGTVAGLLARMLLPAREPSSALTIVTLGILGSVIGPLILSLVFPNRVLNPIGSPLAWLAAIGGALALMVLFRVAVSPRLRREEDSETRSDD
jgi:uncharacterized membrane protein YeaQ/YmgE (transglycosylase-associated protein family)